jgi:hypothetical protein
VTPQTFPPLATAYAVNWRIVTDGQRYRIQRRIEPPLGVKAPCAWENIEHQKDRNAVEYRWLWLARLRMRVEQARAEREGRKREWRVV